MSEPAKTESGDAELAARCHEIQVALGTLEVPEYESLLEIGMAVRLALHIRGLPLLKYEQVRLVSIHFLGIPGLAVERILRLLAEVEFVRLETSGHTIRRLLPQVPYYEDLYQTLGEYGSSERTFSEAEELTLDIVRLRRVTKKLPSWPI